MVTTSANLQSGMMQYSSQDGTLIDAYFSQPAASGRYPCVIVTMEGMGLEDDMKEPARKGQQPTRCWRPYFPSPTRRLWATWTGPPFTSRTTLILMAK